jgi:hypothetical protein
MKILVGVVLSSILILYRCAGVASGSSVRIADADNPNYNVDDKSNSNVNHEQSDHSKSCNLDTFPRKI